MQTYEAFGPSDPNPFTVQAKARLKASIFKSKFKPKLKTNTIYRKSYTTKAIEQTS